MENEPKLNVPPNGPEFARRIRHHLRYTFGQTAEEVRPMGLYRAVARSVRDLLTDRLFCTEERVRAAGAKRLYYFSIEYLPGRFLRQNLINLGLLEVCQAAVSEFGVPWQEVLESERDPALGNGGLGRLAACFLDSMATLGLPGYGYGINYQFGLFRQIIRDGMQEEQPDYWLAQDSPWQIERWDESCRVPLYGRIEHAKDRYGQYNPMWLDWKFVTGVPCDIPIPGFGGQTVNFLRLFSARASHEFDMAVFNEGDYFKAVEQKISTETISKVLYPADSVAAGRELRLVQEYFLVACALQDLLRRFEAGHDDYTRLSEQVAIQLNDTHPALAVAELMRVLVDEQALGWERSWEITQSVFSYTNHTLMPEALEKWPVPLLQKVLPRHLQIILEINQRFLDQVTRIWPEDEELTRRVSLIEEAQPQQVRMAHLSIVGSHSVNGVSAIHTELVKTRLVPDFFAVWPEKFNNKTNGVTPRRWLLNANPRLADLITATIGRGWETDLDKLRELEGHAADETFLKRLLEIKLANKCELAERIQRLTNQNVAPDALLAVQAKRIHEYKRQLLLVMLILHQFFRIMDDGVEPATPGTFVFSGKAAPGYWAAKEIIRLIHQVSLLIQANPRAHRWLRVVFLPDYRVSLAEQIIPAADLSVQISTAGTEASGTGNMKFALNGSATIGTLDGATIEIRQEVGDENIYIFGLTWDEIQALRRSGTYDPQDYLRRDDHLRRVVEAFRGDRLSSDAAEDFRWIFHALTEGGDPYYHLADFRPFVETWQRAAVDFARHPDWACLMMRNVARMGKFSSDRTIREYARDIWQISPPAS
ncbi:MAG: glycogen/starch/alpha-glucan phosphorylase [Acidobacteria bacterium]|nr:glycogen/starch/alpha-glucan phosphorylase [Acidobacteriota bacterium]